jgi:hypothetical protein
MATLDTGGEVKKHVHFELDFVAFHASKLTSPPVSKAAMSHGIK